MKTLYSLCNFSVIQNYTKYNSLFFLKEGDMVHSLVEKYYPSYL